MDLFPQYVHLRLLRHLPCVPLPTRGTRVGNADMSGRERRAVQQFSIPTARQAGFREASAADRAAQAAGRGQTAQDFHHPGAAAGGAPGRRPGGRSVAGSPAKRPAPKTGRVQVQELPAGAGADASATLATPASSIVFHSRNGRYFGLFLAVTEGKQSPQNV